MRFGGDGNKHNPCLTPTPHKGVLASILNYVYFQPPRITIMSISTPFKSSYGHFQTLHLTIFGSIFSKKYCDYFQRSYSKPAFMSISIWLYPTCLFCDNYGYFHMSFYRDPIFCFQCPLTSLTAKAHSRQ